MLVDVIVVADCVFTSTSGRTRLVMNVDDDPWLDEDASAPAVLERNAAQDWERLSTKFSDVCAK